jgi:pimeloyl-ACP methyl ester carboxylesterase
MRGTTSSHDGIAIAFDVAGTGPPSLVFVHGWSCDRSYWAAQMEAFAADHRVVAVDLAGHGESGGGRDAWTMPAFGADVAAVATHLDLDDIVLVGHSMGGDVIVEAALLLAGRVRGLIWVDVYRSLDDPISADELEAFVAPFETDFVAETDRFVRDMFLPDSDEDLVRRVAGGMSSRPPEIAIDAMRNAAGNEGSASAALDRLGLPGVAINREGPGDPESLRRHGMELVTLAALGHFPMLEDPRRFNQILRDALRDVERRATSGPTAR